MLLSSSYGSQYQKDSIKTTKLAKYNCNLMSSQPLNDPSRPDLTGKGYLHPRKVFFHAMSCANLKKKIKKKADVV
jgi:hypothetical protein